MAVLRINAMGGIRPVEDKRLLGDNEAQIAHNCDLDAGNLRMAKSSSEAASLPDANRKSIYLAEDGWMSWLTDVNVVKHPVALDQHRRIYWTGDGVPKVRGFLNGVPVTYDLGIPRPTAAPSVSVTSQTSSNFTRVWHCFYEEPNGEQRDAMDLAEGSDIIVVTPGKEYRMDAIPARVTASAIARFVLWFDAYRVTSAGATIIMGRLYPNFSDYRLNSDLYVQGAKVEAKQRNTGGVATFSLTYKTDEASKYTVDRPYVYTFVSVFGEEGPPSPPSPAVVVDPSQQANINGMETSVPGTRNIVSKRIYRVVTGDAGADFQLVATVPISQTYYQDSTFDEDAGAVLKSTTWYPPPEDLKGIIAMPGSFLVGFTDRSVRMTPPNQPHAWPAEYDYIVEDTIVGVTVSDNTIFVATEGLPVIINAPDPVNISPYVIPAPQPCRSKRGLFQWGGAIFYPSDDGIVQAQGTTAVVITDDYIDKATWQSWKPETMIFAAFDNRLLVFSENQHLRITIGSDSKVIVTRDDRISGYFDDLEHNKLYIIAGNKIRAYDTGAAVVARWRSKEFVFNRPLEFSSYRLIADSYPVTLNMYANGILVVTRVVPNDTKLRLPKVRAEKYWAMEAVSQYPVSEISIATSMEEL